MSRKYNYTQPLLFMTQTRTRRRASTALAAAVMVLCGGCAIAPIPSPQPQSGLGLAPSPGPTAPIDLSGRAGQWFIAASHTDEIEPARLAPVRWAVVGKDVRQETIYLAQLAAERAQEAVATETWAGDAHTPTGQADLVIRFATGRAGPMPPASAHAAEIARLRKAPVVLISGHTDAVGSEASNLRLSRARVDAVQKWLMQHGISNAQIHKQAFGESRPAHSNDTPDGRSLNRRVEISR